MELSQNDINFIKSLLGSEDVRVRFVEVVGKFIDELKDIETLPLSEPKKLAEILIDRLDTVKNLKAIVQRIVIIASEPERPAKYSGL